MFVALDNDRFSSRRGEMFVALDKMSKLLESRPHLNDRQPLLPERVVEDRCSNRILKVLIVRREPANVEQSIERLWRTFTDVLRLQTSLARNSPP